MTFIDRIESLSARFLSERTHELIVAPAIADLQHDSAAGAPGPRERFSVVVALAGAAYEELTSDLRILQIAGLAVIPAIYYAFLLILVMPEAGSLMSGRLGPFALPIAIAAILLSLAPVLACCWPERTARRSPQPE
jgi:hypothetical protein